MLREKKAGGVRTKRTESLEDLSESELPFPFVDANSILSEIGGTRSSPASTLVPFGTQLQNGGRNAQARAFGGFTPPKGYYRKHQKVRSTFC